MRFGLIGFGAWGKASCRGHPQGAGRGLAAIACASEASAQAAREAYPQARIHRDWRALVADLRSRPSTSSCRTTSTRRSRSRRSTRARTCCSKPMASTIAECEQILAAVRRTGRVLSVGHEFRISTQWGFIKRLIAAGEIGELLRQWSLFRFPGRTELGDWRYGRDTVGSQFSRSRCTPRHADVVVRRSRRPGERGLLAIRRARRRDVRQLLGRHRWPDGPYARDADPRRLRAPPRRRSGGPGKLGTDLVVRHHGCASRRSTS